MVYKIDDRFGLLLLCCDSRIVQSFLLFVQENDKPKVCPPNLASFLSSSGIDLGIGIFLGSSFIRLYDF